MTNCPRRATTARPRCRARSGNRGRHGQQHYPPKRRVVARVVEDWVVPPASTVPMRSDTTTVANHTTIVRPATTIVAGVTRAAESAIDPDQGPPLAAASAEFHESITDPSNPSVTAKSVGLPGAGCGVGAAGRGTCAAA